MPVSELASGLIRRTYPGQIQAAYGQPGQVSLIIAQRWACNRLAALRSQLARNISTADAISATFGMLPAAFDEEFDALGRARFAPLLANMSEWERQYGRVRKAIEAEEWA